MSTFQLLKTGNEPLLKVGDHVRFIGDTWKSELANKTFIVTKTGITHFRDDLGIFPTSGTDNDYVLTVGSSISPDHIDSLFQIRMQMIGSAQMYIKFPEGNMRGGLEQDIYATPDPDSDTMRMLGYYTENDLKNHKLEVFEAYGKGPSFEIKNFAVPTKVILDMIINEMKIKLDESYRGDDIVLLEDDKVMGW